MKRRTRITLALIIFTLFLAFNIGPVEAFQYRSYTYDFWAEAVPSPDPYVPVRVLHGTDLGIGELRGPQDLFVGDDDTIWLVDSGNDRVVHLDEQWNVIKTIDQFETDGEAVGSLNNPQGVFIHDSGHIFIADRDNSRILRLDEDGQFVMEIGQPETELEGIFPEHFRFRPRKVAVDRANRIYIIVEGLYEGLLELDIEGNFRGFMGAPRVSPSVVDYFWSRVASDEQRQRMALFLPTEYSNLDLDDRGFIYTTVSGGQIQQDQTIRRLNPAGDDILKRMGFFTPMGDVRYSFWGSSITGRSVLIDIVARQHGMYSVLDRRRGRVFTYDDAGNLLYVFGGLGQAIGLSLSPSALAARGEEIMILDSRTNRITVFRTTEFARLIHQALAYYNRGNYERSTETWKAVLQRNANFELAYTGIGNAYLRQERYEEAMYNFFHGNNREGYSEAFYRYRRDRLSENFGTLMTFIILIPVVWYLWLKVKVGDRIRRKIGQTQLAATIASDRVQQKRSVRFLKETARSLWYATHVIFHPYDGFWDLKFEKRGNYVSATILLFGTVVSYVFLRQYSGFIFNYNRPEDLNIFIEITSVALPFALWCIVNWALTTLMDGKGTLKDIYIATAYSLTPLILINVPATVMSNFITIEEGAFYYFFMTLSVLWFLSLVFLGTMITHDYDMGKTFITSIAVVVGMGTVLFVGLLFFNVIDRMIRFVQDIYTEMAFRL